MKLTRKTLIQAKIETTYGVAPNSFAATDALLMRDASINPSMANLLDRDLLNGQLGAQPQLRTSEAIEIRFTVELAGSGTKGTAPAWGKLLQACGWKASITAGTKVEYSPVSKSFDSISFRYVVDGTAHIALGCRGTFNVNLAPNEIPSISFTFTGLKGTISEIPQPTAGTGAWKAPVAAETQNTPNITLDGAALCTGSLSIDGGNEINRTEFIGCDEVSLINRAITGSASFTAPEVTDKDFFAQIRAATLVPFAVTHGTKDGNIIEFTAPKVQLNEVNYGDRSGFVTLEAGLRFTPKDGNDELLITSR